MDEGREPSAWMGDAIWAAITLPRTIGFVGGFAGIALVAFLIAFELWAVVMIAAAIGAVIVARTLVKRVPQ